jgi:hypothetical protein
MWFSIDAGLNCKSYKLLAMFITRVWTANDRFGIGVHSKSKVINVCYKWQWCQNLFPGAYFIIRDLKISAADFEELFQPFAY